MSNRGYYRGQTNRNDGSSPSEDPNKRFNRSAEESIDESNDDDEDKPQWSIKEFEVNLISILNDPRNATANHDLLYRDWGTLFTEPAIPASESPFITTKDFNQSAAKITNEQQRSLEKGKQYMETLENINEIRTIASQNNADSVTQEIVAALSDVPAGFFREDFDIQNPENFRYILSGAGMIDEEDEERYKDMSENDWNSLLQEQYSSSLDLVEHQLAQQISRRSTAFFRALTSHQILHKEVVGACENISKLRGNLGEVDRRLTFGGLQLLKYRRRQANLSALCEKLKLVATVQSTQQTIQMLLSTSDYVGALDLISTAHQVIDHELAGVHSFRHLSVQLNEMEKLIHKLMESEFVRVAVELATSNELVSHKAKSKIEPLLYGLIVCDLMHFRVQYKTQLLNAVKQRIRNIIDNYLGTLPIKDNTGNDLTTKTMDKLDTDLWIEVIIQLFPGLRIILSNCTSVQEAINDILLTTLTSNETNDTDTSTDNLLEHSTSAPTTTSATLSNSGATNSTTSTPPPTPIPGAKKQPKKQTITMEQVDTAMREGTDTLNAVAEVMHVRIGKLINNKVDSLSQLAYSQFLKFHLEVSNFIDFTKDMIPRMSQALKNEHLFMVRRFFEQYHAKKKAHLTVLLENERWQQAEVAYEFQCLVETISEFEADTKLQKETEKKLKEKQASSPQPLLSVLASVPQAPSIPSSPAYRRKDMESFLVVDHQKFAVVGSMLMFLKMVLEYLSCARDIPFLSVEISQRLIELLKFYNIRTCDLILGAGAINLKVLRKITAKHLALSSQSLNVILLQIPHLRSSLSIFVGPKQRVLLAEFDRVSQDYRDHDEQLVQKIVGIMQEVFSGFVHKQPIMWDKELTGPVSMYMRGVVEQTVRLHKVLQNLMDPERLNLVLEKIYTMYIDNLKEIYSNLNFSNANTQKRLTTDVRYFVDQLGELQNIQDAGREIERFVQQKIDHANRV